MGMGREATGGNVTERPILFSGAMVRAILQGEKQQTRRVVRGVEECPHGYDGVVTATVPQEAHLRGKHCFALASGESLYLRSPYGSAGDRLWVRETFLVKPRISGDGHPFYRATEPNKSEQLGLKWKPSIFMPRWACRLELEVTGVRVERLQAISGRDAQSEGWSLSEAPRIGGDCNAKALLWYRNLWNSLNAKRGFGWAANPWVWVVEFKREKK